GGPQYLACYELESVAVIQTPAFTNRPRTPWGQKGSPSVIWKNLTRIVGEQIYPDGGEMGECGMAAVLEIWRESRPARGESGWQGKDLCGAGVRGGGGGGAGVLRRPLMPPPAEVVGE